MNPNWLGVISAILAFAAFFVVYRVAKDAPVKRRILLALLATVAATPGATFAAYYAHIFPESGWYYEFRSIRGTEFLVVFLGVAGGMVATLLPRVLLVLPLLGVAAFSIAPIIKPFMAPIPAGTLRDEWDGGICLQSTPSTCGAASTATILKQLGVKATESELAAEAHSYAGGTEAWYLARAARSRGLDVDFVFTAGVTPENGLPAVVGVRLGKIGHFIPILGREGDRFIVGDPLHGRELLSRDELDERYEFTGFHMRINSKGEFPPAWHPATSPVVEPEGGDEPHG
jgi:predicted double-glycine peptidase